MLVLCWSQVESYTSSLLYVEKSNLKKASRVWDQGHWDGNTTLKPSGWERACFHDGFVDDVDTDKGQILQCLRRENNKTKTFYEHVLFHAEWNEEILAQ